MSRSSAKVTIDVQVAHIEVGGKDVMSQLARLANLPTCGQIDSSSPGQLPCTRAAGHNESKEGHAGSLHVSADARGIALAVWP